MGLRPLSGSVSICLWSTVWLTSGVEVGTSDEPASTLTTSLTLPSASFAVIEYSCPTAMAIPVKLAPLKLGRETSSL